MKKPTLSESNFDLWLLIGEVSHELFLARRRELSPYNIPVRQLQILRAIQALGSKATLSEISNKVEREFHVISRHTINMEKDGLITRIQNSPKSTLLRLELTKKGLDVLKISRPSTSIDKIFSSLSKVEREQVELILKRILIQAKEFTKT